MYDIRSWLSPCLADKISGQTKPHHFKFLRNGTGEVILLYKGNSQNNWHSVERSLFKHNEDGSVCLPKGTPKIEVANFDKINTDTLERHLDQWSALFSDQRGQSELKWWQKYISEIHNLKEKAAERLK